MSEAFVCPECGAQLKSARTFKITKPEYVSCSDCKQYDKFGDMTYCTLLEVEVTSHDKHVCEYFSRARAREFFR